MRTKYKIETDFPKLKIPESKIQVIIETLNLLFPNKGDIKNLSIRHKDNFHRYFGNTLFESDLSEGEFKDILLKDDSQKITLIKDLIKKGKSNDLKVRVRTYEAFKSKEEFEGLIKTWVLLFNLADEGSIEIFLLRLMEPKSKEIFKNANYVDFFVSLFDTSQVIHFKQTTIIRDILRHYINDPSYKFIINKSEAQEIAINRLREHTNKIVGIDYQCFLYYYNCYESIDMSTNRVVLMSEASTLMFGKIKERPDLYIKYIIRPTYRPHDGKTYTFEPFIKSYFGDYNVFRDFLTIQAKQDGNVKDILRYFNAFEQRGFSDFTSEEIPRWINFNEDGGFEFVDIPPEPMLPDGLDIENLFFAKIKEYNTFDFNPQKNVKHANKFDIDILLTAFNNTNHRDKVIEIKYLNDGLSIQTVRESIKKLSRVYRSYSQLNNRRAVALLIIVYSLRNLEQDQIIRFSKAIEELKVEISDIEILLMTYEEAQKFDIKKIL